MYKIETENIKNLLDSISNILDFTTSAIEVVANSCSYKDDYAAEDVLRLVLKKEYDIIDKISYLQVLTKE